jgi:chromate reductase
MTYNVGVLLGSLASTSINRKFYNALNRLSSQHGLKFTEIPTGNLPLFNSDFEADYPQVGRDLKKSVEDSDAILIVSPEYNRSIPGTLKNALDWTSRPWGQNSFNDKPTAVTGASPGNLGTARGQRAIREVLAFLNAPTMMQPEVYLHFTPGLIEDDGTINDESTEAFLNGFLESFAEFIKKVLGR